VDYLGLVSKEVLSWYKKKHGIKDGEYLDTHKITPSDIHAYYKSVNANFMDHPTVEVLVPALELEYSENFGNRLSREKIQQGTEALLLEIQVSHVGFLKNIAKNRLDRIWFESIAMGSGLRGMSLQLKLRKRQQSTKALKNFAARTPEQKMYDKIAKVMDSKLLSVKQKSKAVNKLIYHYNNPKPAGGVALKTMNIVMERWAGKVKPIPRKQTVAKVMHSWGHTSNPANSLSFSSSYGLTQTTLRIIRKKFRARRLADNPTFLRLWNQAVADKRAGNNVVSRYFAGTMTRRDKLKDVFGAVQQRFVTLAEREGVRIPRSYSKAWPIHHWNFLKQDYADIVLDPGHLFFIPPSRHSSIMGIHNFLTNGGGTRQTIAPVFEMNRRLMDVRPPAM